MTKGSELRRRCYKCCKSDASTERLKALRSALLTPEHEGANKAGAGRRKGDYNNNNNYFLIRDDPNIHQRVGTLRNKEYSPTLWEEFNLSNAGLDISHTQLSRLIL